MIEDLRRLESGSELETDLCVIGSGAAGIAIAREFFSTNREVLLLESGGFRQATETDSLNAGESSGIDPASLTEGRGRSLGGSTALWAGQCLPPDPSTFGERAWVPHSGWPFDGLELESHLRRAEALFGIEGEVYDERVWAGFGVSPPGCHPSSWRTASRSGAPSPTLVGSTATP